MHTFLQSTCQSARTLVSNEDKRGTHPHVAVGGGVVAGAAVAHWKVRHVGVILQMAASLRVSLSVEQRADVCWAAGLGRHADERTRRERARQDHVPQDCAEVVDVLTLCDTLNGRHIVAKGPQEAAKTLGAVSGAGVSGPVTGKQHRVLLAVIELEAGGLQSPGENLVAWLLLQDGHQGGARAVCIRRSPSWGAERHKRCTDTRCLRQQPDTAHAMRIACGMNCRGLCTKPSTCAAQASPYAHVTPWHLDPVCRPTASAHHRQPRGAHPESTGRW